MRARMPWLVPALCALLIGSGTAAGTGGGGHVAPMRVDVRELGFPPLDVIPRDESEIRALAAAPDGRIFGATSGRRSHLFALDPNLGVVEPLGYLAGARVVHRSLVRLAFRVRSTSARPWRSTTAARLRRLRGRPAAARTIPRPTANRTGHSHRSGLPCGGSGVMVAGEGIYTLAMDAARGAVYGLTYPGGYLFRRDLESATTAVLGRVAVDVAPASGTSASGASAVPWPSTRPAPCSRREKVATCTQSRQDQTPASDRSRLPGIPGREAFNRARGVGGGIAGTAVSGRHRTATCSVYSPTEERSRTSASL